MVTIFDKTIESVRNGASFSVSFEERTLTVNGKKVIDRGKYKGELGIDPVPLEEAVGCIESLYARYKHSVPSERSERKRRRYFKALREDELGDSDMCFGMLREESRAFLELYILCLVLNGSFVWNEERLGKWFWQSEKDKDLVILRKWIDSNITNN